jgi:hypothetical protein
MAGKNGKKRKINSRTLKLSETEIEEKAVVEKPPRVLE